MQQARRLWSLVWALMFVGVGAILAKWPTGVSAVISDDLVVRINSGFVRGVRLKAATNKDVDVWYGIPYAKPPLGDLRFRHPVAVEPWDGVRDTTMQPNSCVQIIDQMFPGFPGAEMWNANTPLSEDCLYLNVVVPTSPRPTNSAVMVWIYGGGFYAGTSTLDVYDMRVLAAEQNIIMVSMQYRVASLGYLFFDLEDVPGNAGMYDQLMALQWVHDNIASFGGNKDNVTIFGESAGGASVGYHLLSPLSRPLFSQAIMQSASPLVPWGVVAKEESIARGLRLAEAMKCPHDRDRIADVVKCLREADAQTMVDKEWDGVTTGIAEFPFVPIIDGTFLDMTPHTAVKNNAYKHTNVLTGFNSEEGNYFIMYYLTELFKKEENIVVTREDFLRSVGELNLYIKSIGLEAIAYEYTNWLKPRDTVSNRDALDKMVGDYAFTCPTLDFAHRLAASTANAAENVRVYVYTFTERASTSPWPTWAGTMHGDEVAFIFGEPLNRSRNYDQSEVRLSRRIMEYWANFAKTGNPSLSDDNRWTSIYWPEHTPLKREVLVLDANFSRIVEGPRVRKCAFWKKFLPRLMAFMSTTDGIARQRSGQCDATCCSTAPPAAPVGNGLTSDPDDDSLIVMPPKGQGLPSAQPPSTHLLTLATTVAFSLNWVRSL